MSRDRDASQLLRGVSDPRVTERVFSIAKHILIFLGTFGLALMLMPRLGLPIFLVSLIGVFFGVLYAFVSFRYLQVPLIVWILAIGGFRFLVQIQAPVLPDMYLDRLSFVWLTLVFMIKFMVERKPIRRPWRLDFVLMIHATYLFTRIALQGFDHYHLWTMSIMTPYAAYFFSKNILTTTARIRFFLGTLLILTIYYNFTAVAEKLDLNWAIWPKAILTDKNEFVNRSIGPFLHAPLFGTIIGMLLPVHLYFIATARNKMVKVLVLAAMVMGFAGLYFTYTRGSWLAGIAALGVAAFLNRKQYLRILLPAVIVVPIIAVGFLGLAQDKFMKERVENENTLGSRVATAVTAMRIWRDHPLVGVGYFQYRSVLNQYVAPVSVPALGTIRFVQYRKNPIHDIYLGPLAEEGILGSSMHFAVYFLIFRAFLMKLALARRKDHFAVYMVPVLAGICIGYLVGGIAIDYRFFSFVGTLFFACAGIVDGYQPEETETTAEAPDALPQPQLRIET